jgi:Asp-tRNA(Asn)/Glu-tRNA(Gln) amidotransferase A subunit family amidase
MTGSLDPIAEFDRLTGRFEAQESQIQAFVPSTVRLDVLKSEAVRQAEHPDPEDQPLQGLYVGVKDIFHVDGYPTRAGSKLPEGDLEGQQAETVTHLMRLGARVFGKTVTTEFAYFGPGPTRNPRNLMHTPGGSSSGSAAAVAAGMVPAALGTQTIGSIIRPAAFCGVVGYKPTSKRLSTQGVIPLSPTLDHVGLFSSDAASMYWLAGHLVQNWNASVPTRKPVLGIPAGPYLDSTSAEGMSAFEVTHAKLTDAGYEVRVLDTFEDFDDIVKRHKLILAAEAAAVHEDWYERHADLYHPMTAELIEKGRDVDVSELNDALRGPTELRLNLAQRMRENKIDLWICPSAPGTAPRGLESTGDPVMNLPWTQCGFPSVTLPDGENEEGLPYGLQLCAEWHEDERLLHWTVEIESDLKG